MAKGMQTINNLYSQLCNFAHLLTAYRKARKGTKTADAERFEYRLEYEIAEMLLELQTHSYQPAKYRYFSIYDPKERLISVAPFRDRVVHHAVVALLEPFFETRFIYHSYATRKYKGTHAAVKAAQAMLKKHEWYLKADIRKYFESVSHEILLNTLDKYIADKDFMQLITAIIRNAGTDTGLPIGNLTSQFFANIYLHGFDNWVLRTLKPGSYIRYMDDFVLFANNKQQLQTMLVQIETYLHRHLRLTLKPQAVLINRAAHGLGFLGTRIFRQTVRVKKENLKRCLKRMRYKHHLWQRQKITEQQFLCSANSIMAHLAAYNTFELRKKIRFWHE